VIGLVQAITGSFLSIYVIHCTQFEIGIFTQVQIIRTATTVVAMILINLVSKSFEKATLLNFGCILGATSYILMFLVPGSSFGYDWYRRIALYVASVLNGASSAILFTLPNTMMADVTDVSLYKTKTKQEGFMYSAMETIQSVVQAVGVFVISTILDEDGYSNSDEQSIKVQWSIRNINCIIPCLCLLLIWLMGSLYPLNRDKYTHYVKLLKKLLRKGQSVVFLDAKEIGNPLAKGVLEWNQTNVDGTKNRLLNRARESRRKLSSKNLRPKVKRIHVGESTSEKSIELKENNVDV